MNVQSFSNMQGAGQSFPVRIYDSGFFRMETQLEAGRVARAFQNYVFMLSNFESVMDEICEEPREKALIDRRAIFAQKSGLNTILGKIEGVNNIDNVGKMKILLELYFKMLNELDKNELIEEEKSEFTVIETLMNADNPLSDGPKSFLDIGFAFIGSILTSYAQQQQS